jgi:hypothetical protein
MPEPIIYIEPERLARWKRRYPIHWKHCIEAMKDGVVIERGEADPAFVHKACLRAWELLLSMYDLACPTERHRQKMRRGFRLMLAEFPQIDAMFPHFRQRLNEHDQWVKFGMDELDPDEIERG